MRAGEEVGELGHTHTAAHRAGALAQKLHHAQLQLVNVLQGLAQLWNHANSAHTVNERQEQ